MSYTGGLQIIPNQPINLAPEVYESCETYDEHCVLIGTNDTCINLQVRLEPCSPYSFINQGNFYGPELGDVLAYWSFNSPEWSIKNIGTSNSKIHRIPIVPATDLVCSGTFYPTDYNMFRVDLTLSDVISGSITVVCGGYTFSKTLNSNGTFSIFTTPFNVSNGNLVIKPTTDFEGSISNIAVYQYYVPQPIESWWSIIDNTGQVLNYPPYNTSSAVQVFQEVVDGGDPIDFFTFCIVPSILDVGCYKLRLYYPCEIETMLNQDPVLSVNFRDLGQWEVINNCKSPCCYESAYITQVGDTLQVSDSVTHGNCISVGFQYIPNIGLESCCYYVKIKFGFVDAGWTFQPMKDNCPQYPFSPTSYSTYIFRCCDISSLYFNLDYGPNNDGVTHTINIESIDYIPDQECHSATFKPQSYTSNCFQILPATELQDTRLIEGYFNSYITNGIIGDSYNLGFWTSSNYGFVLRQRLRLTKFAPDYPTDGKDYITSDGKKLITSAQREKIYQLIFGQLDENQHDTLSTQILCDIFTIDGIQYVVSPTDYKPEWDTKRGYPLADIKMSAMKQGTIIFRGS